MNLQNSSNTYHPVEHSKSSSSNARIIYLLWAILLALAGHGGCAETQSSTVITGREPIVGGPCEGCEAVFEGIPTNIPSVARIAPKTEPGEPLRIEGQVKDRRGPAPGTIIYAYHTNTNGIYPRDERLRGQAAYRHGTLRGWAKADAHGRYRFDTVRSVGYPDSDMPAHIHMHVIEPGRCTYYIDDIVFADDPRLTPDKLSHYARGRGGSGVVTPRRDRDGIWRVRRDIVLGERIPDYPARDK